MEISAASSGRFEPLAWLRAFARWWLKGLRESVPANLTNWADREAMPQLTLSIDDRGTCCSLLAGAQAIETRLQSADVGSISRWLDQNGLTRASVAVGLAIPRQQFLVRDLNVPSAALGALPRILEQEVLRRTPFDPSEIWYGASTRESVGDVRVFEHWIICKDRVQRMLTEIGLTVDDVDFLTVSGETQKGALAIRLHGESKEDPAWVVQIVRALGISAIVVTLLALVAFEFFESGVASSIETALGELRQGTLIGNDETGRLLAMKAGGGILETWNELSRILPDDTFLSELRIADGKIVLTGLSGDAARLVRIIDRSPLFSGAALEGAITPDTSEGKERFRIGLKLRAARSVRSPAGME